MSARCAERLLAPLGIGVSDTTINRMLRLLPDQTASLFNVRVLGIDDWAFRKGQRYGTIFVDLEQSRVLDLLPGREAAGAREWLEQHPEIEIVTSDRAKVYRQAVSEGLPGATHIADRFHLMKNGTDMLIRLFAHNPRLLPYYRETGERIAEPEDRAVNQDPVTNHGAEEVDANVTFAAARFLTVKERQKQGHTNSAIARELQLDRRTVAKYFQLTRYGDTRKPRRKRQTDRIEAYVWQRWQAGETNRVVLHQELEKMGFKGSLAALYRLTRHWQRSGRQPPRRERKRLTPREATGLLLLPEANFSARQQEKREQLLLHSDDIPEIQRLAVHYMTAVRERDQARMRQWLKDAARSKFTHFQRFALSIQNDYQAVMAALKHEYSNGPVEGHVNRLKLIKRMMYGRANLDLLRKRVLHQGKASFT